MIHKKIAFIGAGNMAKAIVLGALNNFYPADKLIISNPTPQKLDFFAELGVKTTTDNKHAATQADVIVLSVKPNKIGDICKQIGPVLTADKLIVSVAAGITTDYIASCLGKDMPIVRTMPNTASRVSSGVTGVFANAAVTEDHEELVEAIFSAISLVIWLDDEQLVPVVTAVSGSGIAYYFRVMELMHKEAVEMGLPDEIAKVMVAQTAFGAAKLALESEESFQQLREDVVSPGGTTQRALQALDEANLESTVRNAMHAAFNRSKEMTEELCK